MSALTPIMNTTATSTSFTGSSMMTPPPIIPTAEAAVVGSMELCITTWLPANGILSLSGQSDDAILTLDNDALFEAPCPTSTASTQSFDGSVPVPTEGSGLNVSDLDNNDNSPHFSDFRDPFYASSFPICYALAATTVLSYMLVIMLFITPRSFFDSGVVYLGRQHGFRNSPAGGINIGGRPWLQKLAAMSVAISLSIATADTFRIAKIQYIWGVQNAKVLQNEVMGSTELKAIRIVSDTFLWLAQAQTLIRLFPRHRERVIIQWAACALISLDVVFSALNSFLYSDPDSTANTLPKSFAHPIPALSYLFQLALGVLYAAWVVYYAIMKKRYAFYHPLMKNMCLVAVISLFAIFMPVVFFILDISRPDFTGWGDYVRWVGAAAASVVVWEWVERIEALEREEKKDGILGREVFDGDDTLEVNASDRPWTRKRKNRKGGGGGMTERQLDSRGDNWPAARVDSGHQDHDWNYAPDRYFNHEEHTERTMPPVLRQPAWLTRPPPAATPVSRTDTASADSTVYAVRYQGSSDPRPNSPSVADMGRPGSDSQTNSPTDDTTPVSQAHRSVTQNGHISIQEPGRLAGLEANPTESDDSHWGGVVPGNSEGSSTRLPSDARSTSTRQHGSNSSRWDVRSRLEEFAANQAERIRERLRPTTNTDNLPVTVIEAPLRRGAALQQVLEEEELGHTRGSSGSSYEESYEDGTQREQNRPGNVYAATSTAHERPIPPNNPPLWPGVRHRHQVYEEDDYSYDDDSLTETSSVAYQEDQGGDPEEDDRRLTPRTVGHS